MALKDVIGQDNAVSILRRTILRNRVPTTYLFAGEDGVGKKYTAINFVKTLNCMKSGLKSSVDLDLKEIDACDRCLSCKKIERGVHPDFLLIKPSGNQIRIEDIRAIDDFLSLKSFEGYYKAVIVDEAEKMNQYAGNAFLKTLEEPPSGTLIILISSNPENLPETILSRCSKIIFRPLSTEDFKRLLKHVVSRNLEIWKLKEGDESPFSENELKVLTGISSHKIGDLLERDLLEERKWFLQVFHEMLNYGKDSWGSRDDMQKWFNYILIFLRDIALLKLGDLHDYIINVDIKDFLLNISKKVDLKTIIECYLRLNELSRYLFFNLNKSLTWNYTGSYLRDVLGVING